MEFKCLCCNSDFTTNSNLRKHERSAKHIKLMKRLEVEPTENVQFRNTISEIEIENGVLKKRIVELEQELKKKQEAINQIAKVVNNLAESKIKKEKKSKKSKPEVDPVIEEVKSEPVESIESEPVESIESEPVESEPVESKVESVESKVESVESEPEPKHKKLTKSSLKSDFEYLKKEDIDFILKNKIDEEGAREIDSVKSMIAYYIESLEIKEYIVDAVEDVLKPDQRNSSSVSKWKKIMKVSIMQDINKLKKPTRRELIRKSYCDLTLDDIDFIIENDLEHDEITKMDITRNRFIGFDKKEKVPIFKTEKERNEYLEDRQAQKDKNRRTYLTIEKDDSPAVEKWKKSYKV